MCLRGKRLTFAARARTFKQENERKDETCDETALLIKQNREVDYG